MRRGQGQILYKFLPEQMVDYSDTGTIGKASSWRAREIQGVDMARLVEAIRLRVHSFGNGHKGFPSSFTAKYFVLLEPLSVEVGLFPLTFFCKGCGIYYSFDSPEEFQAKAGSNKYKCPKCGGELQQTDIVHYCTCGNLMSLVIPKCDIHGREYRRLDRADSDDPNKWRWICAHKDHPEGMGNIRKVGAWCYNHEKPKPMRHGPFRRGAVFYPESISMINITPLSTSEGIDPKLWWLAIAEYLGLESHSQAKLVFEGKVRLAEVASNENKRAELISKGYQKELIDEILKKFGIDPGLNGTISAIEKAQTLLPLSETDLTRTASMLYEYQYVTNGDETEQLSDVIGRVKGASLERLRSSPETLVKAGFGNAYVTTDLPLVRAVFGYSRGDPEKKESILNAFPNNKDYPNRRPIYGLKADTEAIIIELSREKVWKWLMANGWIKGDCPESEMDYKLWFLRNVRPEVIPLYSEIDQTNLITKWVYKLVHSVSHSLIRQASCVSGIDRNTLGELLFPSVPALIIYVNRYDEYPLGGLYSLFEDSLSTWIRSAIEESMHCLHDPVCIETNSACFACLYTSEITCEHFNRDLGRDVLIGLQSKQPFIGFWEGNHGL